MQQSADGRLPAARTSCTAGLLAILTILAACGSRPDTAPPLASASVEIDRRSAPIGAPVDFTYRFVVEPGAVIREDYRVFVHVLHADGRRLWTDDHDPPQPTSTWKAGQRVEYTRTQWVPRLGVTGDAVVSIGLYRGDDRLALAPTPADDRGNPDRAYRVARFTVLPESENTFLIYGDGWYAEEFAPDDPARSWRWTGPSAILTFPNPRRDTMLLLEYAARPDLFGGVPQQVTVLAEDQEVGRFAADSSDRQLKRIPIAAAALGTGEMSRVRIDVDRTFTPAAGDTRQLGLQVYHAVVLSR